MDAFFYTLVLVPALTKILPRSGIAADAIERRLLQDASCSRCSCSGGAVDDMGPIGDASVASAH